VQVSSTFGSLAVSGAPMAPQIAGVASLAGSALPEIRFLCFTCYFPGSAHDADDRRIGEEMPRQ
jgi:hypothetical protein